MRSFCFQCHLIPILLVLLLQAQFPCAFLASPHLFWRRCPSPRVRVASDGSGLALNLHRITVDASTVLDEDLTSTLTYLVRQRSDARWKGDYTAADVFRKQIDLLGLPPGFDIVMEDIARNEGGGSAWKLVYDLQKLVHDLHAVSASVHEDDAAEVSSNQRQSSSVLNLAHAALGMVVSSSERGVAVSPQQLDPLVEQARQQLQHWSNVDNELTYANNGVSTSSSSGYEPSFSLDRIRLLESSESSEEVASWSAVETELRGRKAADAAFWFSLAGISDMELFSLLTRVCVKELQRFGGRPSCRAKDVRGIIERLAAAGVRDDPVLQKVALQCMESKSTSIATEEGEAKIDHSILLDLHSDYCSLMIWKFSTRQRKQRSFLLTAAKHWDERHDTGSSDDPTISLEDDNKDDVGSFQPWDVFADPTRKLVVDVGCGMGVSALGLSSLDGHFKSTTDVDYDWSSYNYIGVDLSQIGIGYAKGIARRWGLEERAAFVVDSAESLLERVKQYPGPIELVMIQFPTPYRLIPSPAGGTVLSDDDLLKGGNSQLPTSADDGFMVTSNLLKLAADLVQSADGKPNGKLILQSNCEDVAVTMRDIAINQAGFKIVRLENEVETVQGTPTKRTMNWIEMYGKRAVGPGWSSVPLLPRKGRTETEIACILNGTPVHRCMLTVPT
jgi:SAM-dependent methyltransferase